MAGHRRWLDRARAAQDQGAVMSVLRISACIGCLVAALALPLLAFADDAGALADARTKWAGQAIPSYTYVLQLEAPNRPDEASEPVRITVRNQKIVGVRFAENKEGRPRNARVVREDLRVAI